jgi:DNA-binding response OmpR family regulator
MGGDFGWGSMLPAPPPTVRCGALEFDRVEHRAVLAGSDLRLTEREFTLLTYLADRANRAVRRSELLANIWILPDDYGANVVDVYVRRLRRKFGAHAEMIRTIRGFGYCLRSEQLP